MNNQIPNITSLTQKNNYNILNCKLKNNKIKLELENNLKINTIINNDNIDNEILSSDDELIISNNLKKKLSIIDGNNKKINNNYIGLINIGNTCYMNSILQCLINFSYIKDIFSNIFIIKELYPNIIKNINIKNNYSIIIKKSTTTLTFQLYQLISAISNDSKKLIKPLHFKLLFCNKVPSFDNTNHHDASEALNYIIDIIHNELECEVNIEYDFLKNHIHYLDIINSMSNEDDNYKLDEKFPYLYELYTIKNALDNSYKKSYSIISKYIKSIMLSTINCTECPYYSYIANEESMLKLNIPNLENNKHLTLHDCLIYYTQIEKLCNEDKYFCQKCNKHVDALKKLTFWILPKILIITLVRFESNNNIGLKKKNNYIEFPIDNLDISPYMSEYSKQIGHYTYDLYCIVNHIGNMNNGHYFSYIRSDNNIWHKIDDENISLINSNNIISNNAYILFYKLK